MISQKLLSTFALLIVTLICAFAYKLSQVRFPVTGIDSSEGMINIAKKKHMRDT